MLKVEVAIDPAARERREQVGEVLLNHALSLRLAPVLLLPALGQLPQALQLRDGADELRLPQRSGRRGVPVPGHLDGLELQRGDVVSGRRHRGHFELLGLALPARVAVSVSGGVVRVRVEIRHCAVPRRRPNVGQLLPVAALELVVPQLARDAVVHAVVRSGGAVRLRQRAAAEHRRGPRRRGEGVENGDSRRGRAGRLCAGGGYGPSLHPVYLGYYRQAQGYCAHARRLRGRALPHGPGKLSAASPGHLTGKQWYRP